MNASEPYTDKDLREWEAIVADPDLSREYPKVVSRMLATIRDRDRQIASLESQVQTLEHWINSQNINTEARRAEAFALYQDLLKDAKADTHRFEEYAAIAVRNAMALDSAWEKRNG